MTAEAEGLRGLLAISRAITGASAYEEVVDLVVQKACGLLRASCAFLLLGASGAEASVVASVGLPSHLASTLRGVLDERIEATLRAALGLAADQRILSVPMIVRGDLQGLLVVVGFAELPEIDDAHREFLVSALADQAAIAVGNARHLRELEEALAWLRTVIETSPVAILLIEGASGRRVVANRGAEALFGHPFARDAGVSQYAEQLRASDGTPLPLEELPAFAAMRGGSVDRELLVRREDGASVPVLARAAPIRDDRGEILGGVVLYEDISLLKGLERMREEWTSIVAHDLRTPLNEIALRAQLLERRASNEEVVHGAQRIRATSHRLNRMVNDLLDVSLIESHHLSLVRRPCDVATVLGDIVEHSAVVVRGHDVDIVVPAGLPAIDVDPGRLEQVIVNLLTNALKYGAPGTPIQLRASAKGDMVEIVVRNLGPGMAPDTAATLFERFRRGDDGSRKEGLGLGLYIAKGIVEAHGGTIWAESTPGEATELHLTVPVAAPDRVSAHGA